MAAAVASAPAASRSGPSQSQSHPQPLFSTQTPLQTPSILPPQLTTIRQGLKRRRSSYPPAATPSSTSGHFLSWTIGGTPQSGYEALPTYAIEEDHNDSESTRKVVGKEKKLDQGSGSQWASEQTWESLLNFDSNYTPASPVQKPVQAKVTRKMRFDLTSSEAGPSSRPFLNGTGVVPPPSMSPSKIAQMGQDLAWKTILASLVDVEGVGDVGVSKLLHEVWKRGGGDVVTNQCLWPSIIISLSLQSEHDFQADQRIPTPSAHAALALQQLYNLTLRHWEPSIFTGLLAQFASINNTPPPPFQSQSGETPIYGAATPTKELDMSQWTNLTPGFDWSTILNGIGPSVNADPFDQHPDPREDLVGEHRRNSRNDEDDQARGIDELLAAMEEGRELHERQESQLQKQVQEVISPGPTHTPTRTPAPPAPVHLDKPTKSNSTDTYLPTPETDSSESPAVHVTRQNSFTAGSDQGASPHVTACSYQSGATSSALSTVSKALSTGAGTRAAHPTSLTMPVNSFVPPPPMCMFFNPSFKDITQGKLGVWKGELEVKGQSGGKFSILVIGEQGTENIWQPTTWGSEISYPPPAIPQDGSNFTSSMTPVSHLAREGYVPAAMAMVLCNDPDVTKFCSMVQGLHQEGVAFHLPNPRKLPLMFLPAKFDSSDGLQRLGLAYMTKAGAPVPISTTTTTATTVTNGGKDISEPAKKRKRRQSAPAQAAFKGAATRVNVGEPQGEITASRPKKRLSIALTKVDEDGEKP